MNKQNKQEQKELNTIKRIDDCEIKISTDYNKNNDEYIWLKITYNSELREILKRVCLLDDEKIDTTAGIETKKRYKVKGYLLNGLTESNRSYFFLKDLIDDGIVKIKFDNIRKVIEVIADFKEGVRNAIILIKKYENIDVTIRYKINEDKAK